MTDAEIGALVQQTAEVTAAEVVKQTLISLGIDIKDPLEMQADMQHLRAWRQSISTVKRQGILTAMAIITTGLLGLIWTAFRTRGDF